MVRMDTVTELLRRIIRTRWLSASCAKVGKNLVLREGVKFRGAKGLTIGNNVGMNDDVWINASGKVEIGDNVLIGPKTIIHSANHRYKDPTIPIRLQGHTHGKVIVENDVWIGAGVIILPGVQLGKGCVIAAGRVVTKNVAPYTVIAGVPARKIGERKLKAC